MRISTQIFQLGFALSVVTAIAALGFHTLVYDQQPAALIVVGIAGLLNWYLWSNVRRNPAFTLVSDARRGPVATTALVGLGLAMFVWTANQAERQPVHIFDSHIYYGTKESWVPPPHSYAQQEKEARQREFQKVLEAYLEDNESGLSREDISRVLGLQSDGMPASVEDQPTTTKDTTDAEAETIEADEAN